MLSMSRIMPTDEFYKTPIDLKELKPGIANVRSLDEKTEVVVTLEGSEFKIFRNLCPHMGAPLALGKVCPKDQTVHCPWHGYIFNTDNGSLKLNPNERIYGWMKDLYKTYKPESTPTYKLQIFSSEVRDGKIHVRRSTKS
jgi:nitrite reductase/ring-hydroxylating ferredoxin subunit